MTTKSVFRTAARDSLPVLAGYVVLGMGFGLLMDRSGYGVWWSTASRTCG